jgi:hypothetical protein
MLPVQHRLPAITYVLDTKQTQIPIQEEINEKPVCNIKAVDHLLKNSKAIVTKCDASIKKQITPRDLRLDKQHIWNRVRFAEGQIVSALDKAQHQSQRAIQKHKDLCEAEASLLDIAGDYHDVSTKGLEQQARAKKNSDKLMYMHKLEQGAALEHYATVKPTWLTLAESTINEVNFLGYDHDTKWRSKTEDFLIYMLQHFKREPFGGNESVLKAKKGDHVVVSSSGTASAKALQVLRPTRAPPDNDRLLILQNDPNKDPKAIRLHRKSTDATSHSEINIDGVFFLSDIERPAASFTRSIIRIRLILNTLSKTQVVETLKALCRQASDLEADFNPNFKKSRARVRNANNRLEQDSIAQSNIIQAIKMEISVAKTMLVRAFVEAQEMIKQYREEELYEKGKESGFLPALIAGDSITNHLQSDASPGFSVEPRLNYIYYDLRACCRGGVEREQRNDAKNRFHSLLLKCSNAGSWQESLHVFGAMIHLGVPPTRETIHLVIRACHRARPSQPALAIAMTRKMRALGIASTAKTFHLVMKACADGGNHRMLSAAFRDLLASGHTPTTATYDNILGLCESGCIKADDAPELYESLRIAGVPEKIAYAGSNFALANGKISSRLTRALDYRGSVY